MEKYEIIPTKFFLSQLNELDLIIIKKIKEKLLLLEENPSRNKSLHHKKYNLLRVRLNNKNKEIRIIYTIKNPNVIVLFMINRKGDYNDLEKYLKKVKEDLE